MLLSRGVHGHNGGFSLVEVVVTLAVLGVVAAAVVKFFVSSFGDARREAISTDFNNLTSSIAKTLEHPQSCTYALKELGFDSTVLPVRVPELRLPGGLIATQGAPDIGLKVSRLEFTKVLEDLGMQPCLYRGYIAVLELEAQRRMMGSSGVSDVGAPLRTRFVVAVFTDPVTNKIQLCHAGPSTSCPTTTTTSTTTSTAPSFTTTSFSASATTTSTTPPVAPPPLGVPEPTSSPSPEPTPEPSASPSPSPTAEPWNWGPGMFQCTDRSGSRTCTYTHPSGAVPQAGYGRFEIDVQVNVIAHDGDPREMLTEVTVTLASGGSVATFSRSTRPTTPREVESPMWNETISVPNNGAPSITIRSRVDEATTKTSFTIRAVP